MLRVVQAVKPKALALGAAFAVVVVGHGCWGTTGVHERPVVRQCRDQAATTGGPLPTFQPATTPGLDSKTSRLGATCGGVASLVVDAQSGPVIVGETVRSHIELRNDAAEPASVRYVMALIREQEPDPVARSEHDPVGVGPGQVDSRFINLVIPPGVPPGDYYLFVGTTWRVRLGTQTEAFGVLERVEVRTS